MFGRGPKNRSELLSDADAARARGRKKKAIALYRKALELDPGDVQVHGKLAPLLAAARQRAAAMKSFQFAADGHIKAGFVDRAIGVWAQAAAFFPDEEHGWNELVKLHLQRGRRPDAVKVYLDASRHFNGKKRETGVGFLRNAVGIDPLHVEANLALARALKKGGKKAEAKQLLERLGAQIRGPALKKIRRAQFGLAPGFGTLVRWLRGA